MAKPLGKSPSGDRLEHIAKSPNFRNGSFQNQSPTDVKAEGVSWFKMIKDFVNKPKNVAPSKTLSHIKTDLRSIKGDKPTLVWFGHSSYLLVVKGFRILVDPVFSGNASPVGGFAKAFPGADAYRAEDMPEIDILLITHDHYDHLDYKTVKKLKNKVKYVYTSLGVGSHLEHWGYDPAQIIELDWWEHVEHEKDVEITAAPARHFSGRGLTRGKTLWSSFILDIHGFVLYLGGDSGYDTHFKKIGQNYGPFDLAILETGQYNENWPHIHMMPEEAVKAATELDAKLMLPVHWGKFTLALHPWHEPVERVLVEAKKLEVTVATPMIGEPLIVGGKIPDWKWWEKSL